MNRFLSMTLALALLLMTIAGCAAAEVADTGIEDSSIFGDEASDGEAALSEVDDATGMEIEALASEFDAATLCEPVEPAIGEVEAEIDGEMEGNIPDKEDSNTPMEDGSNGSQGEETSGTQGINDASDSNADKTQETEKDLTPEATDATQKTEDVPNTSETNKNQSVEALTVEDILPTVTVNAKKIPVLTYHKVITDAQKRKPSQVKNRLSISLSKFIKQMQWLRKKDYYTITCEQLYLWRTSQIKLPKRSVLITFDDGYASTVERIIPIFEAYGLRGTVFIIGAASYRSNGSKYITYNRIRELQKTCKCIEFQSHTWALHRSKKAKKKSYAKYAADAAKQRAIYGFSFLAYPYGKANKAMIRAIRENGIKMGFLFGPKKNGYATRKQGLYRVRRIEVSGGMSFKEFKKICK